MTALRKDGPFGEIESPRPLQARDGIVTFSGWCLDGPDFAPPVRLVTLSATIAAHERHARPDLAQSFSASPAATAACGFTLQGRLAPGVHLVRFEAQRCDGSWETFRRYTVAVPTDGLNAAIEVPAGEAEITERVELFGWVHHPQSAVIELSARYGHQDISCLLGSNRSDVAADARAFRSRTNLSAGHGAVRFRARLADGRIALTRTDRVIRIDRDENHDGSIDFAAPLERIPRAAPVRAAPPAPATRPLNITFILHGSFAANSALHVAGLANELAAAGHHCAVAITQDPETIGRLHEPRFRALLHTEAEHGVTFPDGRGPDIVHAWTTRECVRRTAESLCARSGAPLLVHLEDNEQALLEAAVGRSLADLRRLSETELDALVPAGLTHPRRGPRFLATARAATFITTALADFLPAGLPRLLLPPAADARFFFPRPRPESFRRLWSTRPGETVLFYHGNVHAANAAEMRELYLAVRNLNTDGHPVTLIRTGTDAVDFLGADAASCRRHVVALGLVRHHHYLADLMALADIFVQPGTDDAFNHYRLPSKLPEFFALGRPVILPRTNLGTELRHGVDAYVLDRADAAGIAGAVVALREDPMLRERLARGAAEYAAAHFSWRRSAGALANFYASLTL